MGAPIINVSQLDLGGADIALNMGRRFQLSDFVSLQRGTHRIRFGINWEHNRGGPLVWANEPATLTLFSPSQARQEKIAVPAKFETLEDILALPLSSVRVGVGDPRVPQSDGGLVRTSDNLRLFFQDTWRFRPRFVVNYGLAWSLDGNLNDDLPRPPLLAPILGDANLGPSRKEWSNFSPALGFVWTPSTDGDLVVRAGAGLFYDYVFQSALDAERAALGTPGLGRKSFDGNLIENTLPGIQGVAIGDKLNFPKPTEFRGADLIQILPEIRATLLQRVDNTLAVNKQTITGLNGRDVPTTSSVHVNAGVQRRLSKDFVVSADLVLRHFTHVGLGSIDMNRSNSGDRVIRECVTGEKENPDILCSNGPIEFFAPIGVATHKGLLLRADKRFSRGFQFIGSWSWSRSTGTSVAAANGFNLYKWHENRGPLATDFTHILNLAGLSRLPGQLDLGFNFSYSSAPPFNAHLGPIDLNGDGKTGDLLPGSTFNAFNRGSGKEDLEQLVDQFNATYAGKEVRTGVIPVLRLPATYQFGDDFHALDLRLSRSFLLIPYPFRDGARLTLIGDVFNVYNAANLSGHQGNLTLPGAFGRPMARASQIFGSGGPRAFQFAVRVSF